METDTEKEKERQKEILQHFDNTFKTNTINHIQLNMPLLKVFYEYFSDELHQSSPNYDELRKKYIEVSDLLENSFTEGQQTLFEKFFEIGSNMSVERSEQLFYFGYILAKELEKESIIEKT